MLYEGLGATQQLADLVKQDQEKLLSMDQKLETCIKGKLHFFSKLYCGEYSFILLLIIVNAEETEAAQQTLKTAGQLLNMMLAENTEAAKTKDGVCCIMVNQTNKGFYGSIFSLGPAWTLYVIVIIHFIVIWF